MTETLSIAEAELWFDRSSRRYACCDRLTVRYRLADWGRAGVTAVETSVLWRTTGLGEEDYGVHWFDRVRFDEIASKKSAEEPEPFELVTTLPPSPLTYDGQILKVEWLARLRGFFPEGRQRVAEESFHLHSPAEFPKDEPVESAAKA